jgi:hypothetical protein
MDTLYLSDSEFAMALRQLKRRVLQLFQTKDLATALTAVAAMPARRVVNPLFGLLYHGDAQVRWYAIVAMGEVVSKLAAAEMESARVIMRRLMWNLNDESGGMGWGSPEAMGEIMARHDVLAREYASILTSYLNPDGNYLEHEGLQVGLLWAIGRVARIHPELVNDALAFIRPHFTSENAALRGLALWAAVPLAPGGELGEQARGLRSDRTEIVVFEDGDFVSRTIAELAGEIEMACGAEYPRD